VAGGPEREGGGGESVRVMHCGVFFCYFFLLFSYFLASLYPPSFFFFFSFSPSIFVCILSSY